MDDAKLEQLLDRLITYLQAENPVLDSKFTFYPRQTLSDKYELYRGFVNERQPMPIDEDFLSWEKAVLEELLRRSKPFSFSDLKSEASQLADSIYLWQGDITRLAVDGIVNAANSHLLGCTLANHNCIDNAIHTKAGVQLRLACYDIMVDQGRKEPTGRAKITPAFNLPSQYVIHTVGPFIDHKGVTGLKERLLKESYRSCLKLADETGLSEIAFCCISTGEFNYPNEQAAQVASQTVKDYLNETGSDLKVIFNTFKDEDTRVYQEVWQ